MKANKLLLIIQTIGMYAMHTPLYILFILLQCHVDDAILSKLSNPCLIIFLVLSVLLLPVCALIAIFSIISIFKGEESPSKVTMIVKLALIPWYVMNFALCAVLLSGFLNPFLMLAIPLAMAIMSIVTYIYMIATSLPDIAFFINRLIKRKIRISGGIIVSLVFLFIFCLDIVGGVIYHLEMKRIKKEQ